MLSAQQNELALTNLEKAKTLAQTNPDYNNCCEEDDFLLQINFERVTSVYEDCTVVPGEALLFYPTDGSSGTVKVCVSFPTLSQSAGYFEIYDLGDFTEESSITTNIGTSPIGDPIEEIQTEICRDVSYPVLNDDDEDLGFVRSKFYFSTSRVNNEITSVVGDIYGSIDATGIDCSCENNPISFGFSRVGSRRQYTFPGLTSNLSTVDSDCGYCFPPVDNLNSRSDVYIYGGGLNVDVDYTYGQSGQSRPYTLTLAPDFKIRVKEGVTLNLTNVEIAGCKDMWDAIIVEDGGELIINPGFSSPFNSLNKSTISDGMRGIVVEDGGKLTVDNTVFSENLVSITTLDDDLTKSPEINVFGSEFNFGEGVVEEELAIQPFLLQPHFGEVPRAGIELFDVEDGFLIDYGLASEGPSKFENLENGILFENSIGYVSGSIFDWMRSTDNVESGNGVLIRQDKSYRSRNYIQSNLDHPNGKVVFRNSERGVNAIDSYNLYVRYAEFENVDYGIYSENVNLLKVYDNTFDSNISGVTALEDRAASIRIRDNDFVARRKIAKSDAIRLAYTTGFFSRRAQIKDNNFTLAGAPVAIDATNPIILEIESNDFAWAEEAPAAVAVSVNGGNKSRVSGNLIDGTNAKGASTGFSFTTSNSVDLQCNRVENLEKGIQFNGNNGRSKIWGNIMEDSKVGLQVGSDPASGVFDVVGQQVHTGNQWLGTFNEVGAKYSGDATDARFSEFLVDNDGAGFIPPSWTPTEFIRPVIGSSVPFYSCPTGLPPSGNLVDDEGHIKKLLAGQYSWTGKLGAAQWIAKIQALKDYDFGVITEGKVPGITNWANSPSLSEERSALSIASAVGEALGSSALDSDLVVDLTESVDQAYLDVAQATVAAQRSATAGTQTNAAALTEAKEKLDTGVGVLLQILEDPVYDATQKLATARNQNNTGNYTAIHLQNETVINDYILTLAESGKAALEQDISTILAIARQCPDFGGLAVFQARSLAAMLGEDAIYNNEDLCGKEAKNESKRLSFSTNGNLQVYPNPTQSELIVSSGEEVISKISLTDVLGRETYNFQAYPKSQVFQHSIDVSDYRSGIYVLTLKLGDGETISRKVSIQK